MVCTFFFFFFQAEDGIRDYKVTGVQTCALPISHGRRCVAHAHAAEAARRAVLAGATSIEHGVLLDEATLDLMAEHGTLDRKSTRLNSSHLVISYAVFCLKKKKKNTYASDN